MLGLLVNMALLTLWVLLLYLFKRKLTIILIGIAIGIVPVSLFTILVETSLLQTPLTIQVSIVAPIVEESLKFLFILLLAWKSSRVLSEVRIFGAAVGLGFAYFETLGVIANVPDILLRSVSSWPLHIITALFLSYGVESRMTLKKPTAWTVAYFLIALTIHGAFNYTVLFWI